MGKAPAHAYVRTRHVDFPGFTVFIGDKLLVCSSQRKLLTQNLGERAFCINLYLKELKVSHGVNNHLHKNCCGVLHLIATRCGIIPKN